MKVDYWPAPHGPGSHQADLSLSGLQSAPDRRSRKRHGESAGVNGGSGQFFANFFRRGKVLGRLNFLILLGLCPGPPLLCHHATRLEMMGKGWAKTDKAGESAAVSESLAAVADTLARLTPWPDHRPTPSASQLELAESPQFLEKYARFGHREASLGGGGRDEMARMEHGTNTDADFPVRWSIGVPSVAK